MEWRLFIDGIDAYDAYRLSVSEGGYNDLVCLPELKEIPFNDWQEKNGIDPDLSNPVLAPKEVSVTFFIVGGICRYHSLIKALSDGSYHTFRFDEIELTKRLRLVKCGNIESVRDLHIFSLTFSDDAPLDGYEYASPTSAIKPYYDYLIDGKDVSDYGIRMLLGTRDEIVQQPDVKENLIVNLSSLNGQYCDDRYVTYKSRTVALKCLMRARSLREFWQNRDALLYDLIRPDARILKVSDLNKDIPFYYKSCVVDSFYPDKGKVWFEFTLNVEFFKGVI